MYMDTDFFIYDIKTLDFMMTFVLKLISISIH